MDNGLGKRLALARLAYKMPENKHNGKHRRLSANRLAGLAGLSNSMVSHIESRRIANPGVETVLALANVLGVSTEWLLTGRAIRKGDSLEG